MGKRATILFRKSQKKEERAVLREYAEVLAERVLQGKQFGCLFSDDAHLRQLNRDFLGKDEPTDVLSFPSGEEEHAGEMAISLERAGEQAADHGHDLLAELKVLMLHGVLHLKGMDHEKDKGQMRRVETKWRKELGLPGGLIERVRR
jgi:probable rRNA maturation factor